MEWINQFSQLINVSIKTLSETPRAVYANLDGIEQKFFVVDVTIHHPNPEFIMITLSDNETTYDICLQDLMVDRLPENKILMSRVNGWDAFALKLIWLELGMKGYWSEDKEAAVMQFFELFKETAERTLTLLSGSLIPSMPDKLH